MENLLYSSPLAFLDKHSSGEGAHYTCVALSGYIVDICQDTALNITDKIFAALLR